MMAWHWNGWKIARDAIEEYLEEVREEQEEDKCNCMHGCNYCLMLEKE